MRARQITPGVVGLATTLNPSVDRQFDYLRGAWREVLFFKQPLMTDVKSKRNYQL